MPTSTAHSVSPPADILQIADSANSASSASLTPRLNPAPPFTERLASATVSIDGSASQRLSVVISAPLTAENVEHVIRMEHSFRLNQHPREMKAQGEQHRLCAVSASVWEP